MAPFADFNPRANQVSENFRVAIIGSGPAAFYVAERLQKENLPGLSIDMFDRLPSPFGLVRYGVAPDHQKIKSVTRVFDKIAGRPGFRFFGNVDVGRHVTLEVLRANYHAVCFATGAQTDRRLGIPGEDLVRSHPATEFVAWYNGHPDYADLEFDLSVERVAVVGVGNVAVDVARILCRTPDELAQTDIADYALEALSRSKVREVTLLGRRGPAQAAFTNPEIRELGEMADADIAVVPGEIELDPESRADLDASGDKDVSKKMEILEGYVGRPASGSSRLLRLRFLVSPTRLIDDGSGGVAAVELVRNQLVRDGDRLAARATDQVETIPADMVFRSVGYRGVAIDGLPFDERRGIIPNEQGRVVENGAPVPGMYVAGWIKRGPSGVIGTNKPDGKQTAEMILEDLAGGRTLAPESTDAVAPVEAVCGNQKSVITFQDWQRADAMEVAAGEQLGRPRRKFITAREMMEALKAGADSGAATAG